MNIEEFIQHYGTKGMKWGVRKRKVPKQGPSGDAKSAHRSFVKAKVSGPEALTNKELNELNNRLNLEQNYTRLAHQPGLLERGMAVTKQILGVGESANKALQFAESDAAKQMGINFTSKASAARKAAGSKGS